MDVLSRPAPMADHRIFYGTNPYQFGDLWIPMTEDRSLLPLVVFFHGGWWKSKYDLTYAGHLCEALKSLGVATWSVEYRRLGETGGGWPTTFQDAAAGFDFVTTLAKTYPLDLQRVVTMGHSAGGHLAFWAAGKHRIQPKTELSLPLSQLNLLGTIALAGAVDLRLTIELSGNSIFAHDRDEVFALMGGPPDLLPERYDAGNPGDLLPFGIPQILIQGTEDDQIPADLPSRWASLARGAGDTVRVEFIPSVDHLDVADPQSVAWKMVSDSIHGLLSIQNRLES